MKQFTSSFAKHRQLYTFLILVFVSLLLILISGQKFMFKPKEVAQSILSGGQRITGGISNWLVRTVNSIGELKRTRVELSKLQEKLLEYEKITRDIIELRAENSELKKQLGFYREYTIKSIPAEIIAKDPENLFSTLIINKGTLNGVSRNMPVIAYQSGLQGLVGKIVYVNKFTSTVKPLLDPTLYIAARVQNSRYEGLISGIDEASGFLIMKYVSKEAIDQVRYGDIVITSGMGGIYPKGIHIGRVRKIEAKQYETSMNILLQPVIDFSRLEYVFVLSGGKKQNP